MFRWFILKFHQKYSTIGEGQIFALNFNSVKKEKAFCGLFEIELEVK